jgi:hypothetical protein
MNVILNIQINKQIISTFKSYNTADFQKLNHQDDFLSILKLEQYS